MDHFVTLFLTAVITIATSIYTYYSIRVWHANRAAAEVAQQAAFINLWSELNRYLEVLRRDPPRELPFYEALSNRLLEYMLTSLVKHIVIGNRSQADRLKMEVGRLMKEHQIDLEMVPWLRPFVDHE